MTEPETGIAERSGEVLASGAVGRFCHRYNTYILKGKGVYHHSLD